MRNYVVIIAAFIVLCAASCGGSTPALSNTTMLQASAAVSSDQPPSAAQLRRGSIAFIRCRSCHTLEKDGPHLTGPNLHGLIGAQAGVKPGYVFSEPVKSSDVVWNEETLDTWIENPAALIEGSRMVFAGLPSAEDRAALIAYLVSETGK